MTYHKIPEEQYQKAKGQLKLQLNDVLSIFAMYGMQEYIPAAIEEITELTEQFAMRVRGKDIPIKLKTKRNSR
jgi:hypothetical protein